MTVVCVCIQVGLSVFLRASQSSWPDSISGIRCFFSMVGKISLEVQRVPGAVAKANSVLPGTAPCLAFRVIDSGVAGISASVVRPKSCDSDFDMTSDVDFRAEVKLPLTGVVTDRSYVAIKQSVPIAYAAIDQFTISTRRPQQQQHYDTMR